MFTTQRVLWTLTLAAPLLCPAAAQAESAELGTAPAPGVRPSEVWRFMASAGLGLQGSDPDSVGFVSTLGLGVARDEPLLVAATLEFENWTTGASTLGYVFDARVYVGYSQRHRGFFAAPYVGGSVGDGGLGTIFGPLWGARLAYAFELGGRTPENPYGWTLGPYVDGGLRLLFREVAPSTTASGLYGHALVGAQVRFQ